MRELSAVDPGMLLSLFAVLLIAFGIDFHLSRRAVQSHGRRAFAFAAIGLVGEAVTALALVLTWVALWSPAAWEAIDDLLVFVPGSIAVGCAVVLTAERRSDASCRCGRRAVRVQLTARPGLIARGASALRAG